MNFRLSRGWTGVLVAVVFAAIAPPAGAEEPAHMNFSTGAFNAFKNEATTGFQGEYRSAAELWGIKPFAGLMRSNLNEVYAYAGLGMDLHVGGGFVFTPNLAAGYYEKGSGRDLGHPLEFRSGAEFAYIFESGARIGLSFHHLSNASIGGRNPGTELLRMSYSIPFTPLFSNPASAAPTGTPVSSR